MTTGIKIRINVKAEGLQKGMTQEEIQQVIASALSGNASSIADNAAADFHSRLTHGRAQPYSWWDWF
ncbi:MAG: hypothetical protein ACFFGZ_04880 [Candidatus Thorarchaeota archaeon]